MPVTGSCNCGLVGKLENVTAAGLGLGLAAGVEVGAAADAAGAPVDGCWAAGVAEPPQPESPTAAIARTVDSAVARRTRSIGCGPFSAGGQAGLCLCDLTVSAATDMCLTLPISAASRRAPTPMSPWSTGLKGP